MVNNKSWTRGEEAPRRSSCRRDQEAVVQYTTRMAAAVRRERSRVSTVIMRLSSTEQFSETERTDQEPSARRAKEGAGGGRAAAGRPRRREKSYKWEAAAAVGMGRPLKEGA